MKTLKIIGILLFLPTILWAESSLVENSPFVPYDFTGKPGVSAGRTSGPELTGVLAIGDNVRVSLFDKDKKQSVWVSLRDESADFYVDEYDPANKTVRVRYGGRQELLKLRERTNTVIAVGGLDSGGSSSASNESSSVPEAPKTKLSPEKRKEMADKVFDAFKRYVAEKKRRAAEESGEEYIEEEE